MSGRVRRPSSKALEAASNMTKKGTGSSRGSVKGKKPQRKSSQTAKVPTNTAQELEDESSFGADIDADDVAYVQKPLYSTAPKMTRLSMRRFDGPGFDPNSNSLYCASQ